MLFIKEFDIFHACYENVTDILCWKEKETYWLCYAVSNTLLNESVMIIASLLSINSQKFSINKKCLICSYFLNIQKFYAKSKHKIQSDLQRVIQSSEIHHKKNTLTLTKQLVNDCYFSNVFWTSFHSFSFSAFSHLAIKIPLE